MSLLLRTDVKLATLWGLLALLSLLLLPSPCHCPGPSIHPYTDVFPLNYHHIIWCVVAKNFPITRESFFPHFHISCFWVVFHLFAFFLIALQTNRKIKTNWRANLRLFNPMGWIDECFLMMIHVTWLEILLLVFQRCLFLYGLDAA